MGRDFTSIFDFCTKVDTRIVNKRTLEGLVLAGAFDSIDKRRATLFNSIEDALDFGSKARNSKLSAENSLFGGIAEEVKITEPQLNIITDWTQKEQLAKEREVMGFYVTGHPLRKYEIEYKSFATIHLGETDKLENMDVVRACGVITNLKTKIDKSGKTMAFFTLDDFSGSCECLMFSKVYEKFSEHIKEEECVFMAGRPESSGDAIKLHIEEVIPLEESADKFTQSVKVCIEKDKIAADAIIKLKPLFEKYKGNLPLYIHLGDNGSKPRLFFLKDTRVKVTNEFIAEIIALLGEESLLLSKK